MPDPEHLAEELARLCDEFVFDSLPDALPLISRSLSAALLNEFEEWDHGEYVFEWRMQPDTGLLEVRITARARLSDIEIRFTEDS